MVHNIGSNVAHMAARVLLFLMTEHHVGGIIQNEAIQVDRFARDALRVLLLLTLQFTNVLQSHFT